MLTAEYTGPLSGRPFYRNSGIIKVYDRNNNRYSIGEVVYERYDDQNFQYIIKPYWESIEGLPTGLFQGIPGMNMDLRREVYYRVNMTPAIISMRTPSESREDVRQLMACNLFHGYQTLFAIHQNTENPHIHIAINTVSFLDGRKLQINLHEIRCAIKSLFSLYLSNAELKGAARQEYNVGTFGEFYFDDL